LAEQFLLTSSEQEKIIEDLKYENMLLKSEVDLVHEKIDELRFVKDSLCEEIYKMDQELENATKKVKKIVNEKDEEINKKVQEIKALNEQIGIYEKDISNLGQIYNHMNRKLWANGEAQRQLRKLSKQIFECEKINKNYIAQYIYDLSHLIGGGEKYSFKEK
jgi:peptidoglycan hydrolase CwlO-like protein